MGFSRQEYWSGSSFPSPGDLPNPGIEPGSPALQADALPSEPPGKSAAAAAAKLLQSCPILCDSIDGSPPGSPVPGILQARTLEWVAISINLKCIVLQKEASRNGKPINCYQRLVVMVKGNFMG